MYTFKRLPDTVDPLDMSLFDPENIPAPYSRLNTAYIDKYRWAKTGYEPVARAMAGWNREGLWIAMWAFEQSVLAKRTKTGSDVCRDSCLEFFLKPLPDSDERYINIECNALATFHIGLGRGRENRRVLQTPPKNLKSAAHVFYGKWWAVRCLVPAEFLQEEFAGFALESGTLMSGNFYKCGDEAIEHYGMWTDTLTPAPDFHVPERFGAMRLE